MAFEVTQEIMSEPVKQQLTSLPRPVMRLQDIKSEDDTPAPYPTTKNPGPWKKFWREQGQPWRTKKMITVKRQEQLNKRRTTVKPNIEKGKYPFKGMKLRRADVEWLLATHEHQGLRGPIDWSDQNQREHEGLDLRGADLRGVDLHGLPLTRLIDGLDADEWFWYFFAVDERERRPLSEAAILLEGANLSSAHLEGASLTSAHLTGTNLQEVYLEKAMLLSVHAEGANFRHHI